MTVGPQKRSALSGPPSTTFCSLDRQICFDHDHHDSTEKSPPSFFVQISFMALGISSLLPWNAMIITLPFFLDRLSGTPLHDSFTSWLSLLFNAVGLVAMGFATWAGEQLTGPSSFSISMLVLTCLLFLLALFPFLAFPPPAFFAIGLVASSVLAAAGGFLQTSTITLAPRYGTGAIASYMSGSALSAVGISILQVAAAYTSTSITLPGLDSASWNATICFSISALVLVLTLVLYGALRSDDRTVLDQVENFKDFDVEELPSERTHLIRQHSQQSLPRMSQLEITPIEPRSMYGCNFAVFYTAVVTLCLFPAITANIESTNKKIDPLVFNALHFLVFNVADLVGRFFSSIPSVSSTNNTFLITYSVLRSVFIPFFVACNFAGSAGPPFITSDAVYMLGLFLFGLTHGHCSTVSLVAASEREDGAQNGRGARLAQFWMMVGIVVGGGASFGVLAIL